MIFDSTLSATGSTGWVGASVETVCTCGTTGRTTGRTTWGVPDATVVTTGAVAGVATGFFFFVKLQR